MKSKRTKGLMSQSRARFAVSSAWQIHFRTQALIIDNPFSHTNLSMHYGLKSQNSAVWRSCISRANKWIFFFQMLEEWKRGKIRHLYTYMQINFLSYNNSAESNYLLQHYMDKFQEKTKYIHIAPLNFLL